MTRVCGLVLVCCALGCGPRILSQEDGPVADDMEDSGGEVTETMLGGDTDTGKGEGDGDGDGDDGDGDTTGDGDGGPPGDSGGDTKGDGDGDTTGDGDGDTTGDGDGDTTGDPYDPASCKPPAVVVPIPDIGGTTCSAPCMSDVDCPPAPAAGTVSLCALILDMGMLATNCALICDPAETACPIGSSCKVIPEQMDVGVCTYP
jgi:hypothetical protein